MFFASRFAPKALDNRLMLSLNMHSTPMLLIQITDLLFPRLMSLSQSIPQPPESDNFRVNLKSDFQQVSEDPVNPKRIPSISINWTFYVNWKKAYVQIPIGCKKDDLEKLKKILDAMCGG